MRNIINLLIGFYSLYNIGIHLTKYMGMKRRLFNFEVNEYIFLAFWGLIALMCFKQVIAEVKRKSA